MSSVRIRPGPLSGRIRAPPSKSYTHRALVIGHLAGRPFSVRHPLDSDDTRATAVGLTKLGSPVVRGDDVWRVEFPKEPPRHSTLRIDCGESGTTYRFLSALAALEDRPVVITGAHRLSARPIDDLLAALATLGAKCRHLRRGELPIVVQGPIRGGRVSLRASQTSQFVSALLFPLPTLEEDSILELRGTPVSQPYLDATIAVLERHGVDVRRRGHRITIPGRQRIRGATFKVPGDASSAAYLWAGAAVSGGSVTVDGVNGGWPQADLLVLDLLRSAGGHVVRRPGGATVSGGSPRGFSIDLTSAPDLYPLAGVLAATTPERSHIRGAEHVVLKESDRKSATALLARSLGAEVQASAHGLTIWGTSRPRALHLPHLSDHRVVMSAAVGALAAGRESTIGDAGAVRKSFPGFWDALRKLSGRVRRP